MPHPNAQDKLPAVRVNKYRYSEFPRVVYRGAEHKQVRDAEELTAALAGGFSIDAPVPGAEPTKQKTTPQKPAK